MTSGSSQRFADISQAPVTERLEYIKTGAIFETSARRKFKEHLKAMIVAPTLSDEKLVFLTAPAGMGLSSLLAEFAAQFPLAADSQTGRVMAPVINEHIHPSGEIIDYCDELRGSLAIPGYGPMVRQVSFQKTLHLLGLLNTRMVNRTAFMTNKREVENFVHPATIARLSDGLIELPEDFDMDYGDLPTAFASSMRDAIDNKGLNFQPTDHTGERIRATKRYTKHILTSYLMRNMTVDEIKERSSYEKDGTTHYEVYEYLKAIQRYT